jgi:hypothetical protein
MSPGIYLLLTPFAVKSKHYPNWGWQWGKQHNGCMWPHILYRTAILYEMVISWGKVRLMVWANLKTAWVWVLNIEFVWRWCETLLCLMISYHFTVNLSSGKGIRYSQNLYSLVIYLWVYCKWCIIVFLIVLIKGQRLYNVGGTRWRSWAQLVEALRCKPEGPGFNSGWCHWIFSMT